MIPFNRPAAVGNELTYIAQAVNQYHHIAGDGEFTRRCSDWISRRMGVPRALLVTSGTHALEMAAMLAELRPGDEVIMPSYTFVSTANAFLLRGAVPVFVDIRPDTLNIDEKLIEAAVTPRTRAVCVVHYAGVGCAMEEIGAIAARHHLVLIEDAAQAFLAKYKGRYLGTFGDYGAFSFHETKNYSMGEGGAVVLRDPAELPRAEIIREKGTNRSRYFRGEIDKYTWVDIGSSYLPSDINAAYLFGQLEKAQAIWDDRMRSWVSYWRELEPLEKAGDIRLPRPPAECEHNAHMFYIKCADLAERTRLIRFLKSREIECAFHYVPLHSSAAGRRYGRFCGEDRYTTRESERLVRLPLYYGLSEADRSAVVASIREFYTGAR